MLPGRKAVPELQYLYSQIHRSASYPLAGGSSIDDLMRMRVIEKRRKGPLGSARRRAERRFSRSLRRKRKRAVAWMIAATTIGGKACAPRVTSGAASVASGACGCTVNGFGRPCARLSLNRRRVLGD